MDGQYKIRFRRRVQASRPDGLRGGWDEWQVVDGRKVVARFDLERQARDWIAKATGEPA